MLEEFDKHHVPLDRAFFQYGETNQAAQLSLVKDTKSARFLVFLSNITIVYETSVSGKLKPLGYEEVDTTVMRSECFDEALEMFEWQYKNLLNMGLTRRSKVAGTDEVIETMQ